MGVIGSCDMIHFWFVLKFVRGDTSYKIGIGRRRDSNTRQYDFDLRMMYLGFLDVSLHDGKSGNKYLNCCAVRK